MIQAKVLEKAIQYDEPDFKEIFLHSIGTPGKISTSGYRQVKHNAPMLSLDTVVDTTITPVISMVTGFGAKLGKRDFSVILETKFDGVGIDLQYIDAGVDDAYLGEAVTRGDGLVGEDVLRHAMVIRGIPLSVPVDTFKGSFDVRGEVLLLKADLAVANEYRIKEGEKPFANTRNAVAGILRSKTVTDLSALLVFAPYQVLIPEANYKDEEEFEYNSHWSSLTAFRKLCPPATSPAMEKYNAELVSVLIQSLGIDHYDEEIDVAQRIYYHYQQTLRKRDKLSFDIDGMVYKLDNFENQRKLGFTGREPNWAIAHKFPAEEATTHLRGVNVGLGKTGRITPVGEFDPTMIGGVVVTNGNLVHEKRIKELDIAIGDKILIRRAGDVIPEIIKVVERSIDRVSLDGIFDKCPCCGSKLVLDGEFYFCRNTAMCPEQASLVLVYAASRALFNIQSLGEAAISKLNELGYLKTSLDFFTLTAEQLAQAEVGGPYIPKILNQIKELRKAPLYKVIASLGIASCGRSTSRDILSKYPSIDELAIVTVEGLLDIKDVGPVTAQRVFEYFSNEENIKRLKAVEQEWTVEKAATGKSVCVSGGFDIGKEAVKEKLTAMGFKIVDSVSKNLDYLLAGEGSGSKTEKAQKLGIKIVHSIEQLTELKD